MTLLLFFVALIFGWIFIHQTTSFVACRFLSIDVCMSTFFCVWSREDERFLESLWSLIDFLCWYMEVYVFSIERVPAWCISFKLATIEAKIHTKAYNNCFLAGFLSVSLFARLQFGWLSFLLSIQKVLIFERDLTVSLKPSQNKCYSNCHLPLFHSTQRCPFIAIKKLAPLSLPLSSNTRKIFSLSFCQLQNEFTFMHWIITGIDMMVDCRAIVIRQITKGCREWDEKDERNWIKAQKSRMEIS